MDSSLYSVTNEYYTTQTTKTTCTTTVSTTCTYPQMWALIILINPNSDCTSSMVCKGGLKNVVDLKAAIDCSGTCYASSVEAYWDADSYMDQQVSSGYVTSDATTETYTNLDSTSANVCDEVWTYNIASSTTIIGKACVKITTTTSRPFLADDPANEMSINHDPDASSGLATTYTFRARFGPVSNKEDARY